MFWIYSFKIHFVITEKENNFKKTTYWEMVLQSIGPFEQILSWFIQLVCFEKSNIIKYWRTFSAKTF